MSFLLFFAAACPNGTLTLAEDSGTYDFTDDTTSVTFTHTDYDGVTHEYTDGEDLENWTYYDYLSGSYFTDAQKNAILSMLDSVLGSGRYTVEWYGSSGSWTGFKVNVTGFTLADGESVTFSYSSTAEIPDEKTTYTNSANVNNTQYTAEQTRTLRQSSHSQTQTETSSETETSTSTTTKLAQTGQLNWPVPVLAFPGASLFVYGFLKNRKNEENTQGEENTQ